jgi:hypothetical protein
MMVDVAFITRLQLRLAYDVAVLYRVPLDLSDPDDMWKLIRVAFTIKSGEMAREGVAKAVPALMRPVIKRCYSRSVLTAAKGREFSGLGIQAPGFGERLRAGHTSGRASIDPGAAPGNCRSGLGAGRSGRRRGR